CRHHRRSRFRHSRRRLCAPVLCQLHREHRARARPHGRLPGLAQGGVTVMAMRPMLRVVMGVTGGLSAAAARVPDRRAADAAPAAKPTGAWRIETIAGQDGQDSFAAVTSAIGDDDAQLSLTCRRDPDHYWFAVKSAGLPDTVGETTLMVQAGSREPARFTTLVRDGCALIQERAHQTAFTVVFATLGESDAATVEIAIDDRKRVFPLTGFNAAVGVLTERCGFAPDPTRGAGARGGASRRPAPPPMFPRPR